MVLNFIGELKKIEKQFKNCKEVIVNDVKFEISLLTYAEERQVNSIPKEEEDPLAFYERVRVQVLSYSIKKINGIEIPEIVEIEENGKKESKERAIYIRDNILKGMPSKVVDILFDAYVDFKDEIEDKLGKSIKYEWYKTPEQRQLEKEQKLKKEENKEEKPIILEKIEEKEEDNKEKES